MWSLNGDMGGGHAQLESSFPPETVRDLQYRGHRVIAATSGDFGGYQAIWYDADKDVYFCATESEKTAWRSVISDSRSYSRRPIGANGGSPLRT